MTLFHNYECSNGDGTGIAGNSFIDAIIPNDNHNKINNI